MTPAEIRANPNATSAEKRKATCIVANRVERGWTRNEALHTPIGKPHRVAENPRQTQPPGLLDNETAWEDDDRCWYVVARHPDGLRLEEIGELLGVTRERVRQIEQVALRKLEAALADLDVTAEDLVYALRNRGRDATWNAQSDKAGRTPNAQEREATEAARISAQEPSEYVRRVDAAIGELERAADRIEVAEARVMVERVVTGMEGWQEAAE